MTIYCNGSTKATINIIGKETILSNNPPVDVTWQGQEGSSQSFSFSCTQPLNQTFPAEIADIQLSPLEQTIYFGIGYFPDGLPTTCPTLDTANTNRFGSGDTLHIINGKTLTWNGDDDYAGNSGSCSYIIYFGGTLKITDSKGEIFAKAYSKKPQYTVACDNECPSGHIRCQTVKYPGYCCIPCKKIAQRINNLATRI
jgi:uncharacterized Zn-binding protein involved in type VI secretion